jgi:hypothetical protein
VTLRRRIRLKTRMSTDFSLKKPSVGRPKGSTSDKSRGNRFVEITKELFPRFESRAKRASALGCNEADFRRWESGANIDNRALAALLRHGADIGYILTGERSSDQGAPECPRGLLCERLPKLLQLLGEMFEGAAADPEQREALIEAFRTAAAAIQDRKQGGQTG